MVECGVGGEIFVTAPHWTDIPVPSPDMVTASRRHLTGRYATGVDRLLWELEKRTMPDADAVRAVVLAVSGDGQADALDIGAALVTTHAMRLELDLLEADVLDAAKASGMPAESVAAVLELPDAAAAEAWQDTLARRRRLPRAEAEAPTRTQTEASREAAARASSRASRAAGRAAEASRRSGELREVGVSLARTPVQSARRREGTHREAACHDAVREEAAHREAQGLGRKHAERARAHADEARINANEAAERVALGLLRAAEALTRCAARCEEWERKAPESEDRALLRQRAAEYAASARTYREMAARYRDTGGVIA